MLLALLIAAQTWGPQRLPPVLDAEDPLVDAAGIVKDLIVELAYATSDNITGRALYPTDAKCLLRRSVAERLAVAANALRKRGLRLIARDCTRPPDAQEALWRAHPHAGLVADPSRGSLHARGVAGDRGAPEEISVAETSSPRKPVSNPVATRRPRSLKSSARHSHGSAPRGRTSANSAQARRRWRRRGPSGSGSQREAGRADGRSSQTPSRTRSRTRPCRRGWSEGSGTATSTITRDPGPPGRSTSGKKKPGPSRRWRWNAPSDSNRYRTGQLSSSTGETESQPINLLLRVPVFGACAGGRNLALL